MKPQLNSQWRHSSGAIYTVIDFTNEATTQPDRYPVTIVYRDDKGNKWSRPLGDWTRSMTPL